MNSEVGPDHRPAAIGRWTIGIFLAYLAVCVAVIISGILDLELLSRMSTDDWSLEEATKSAMRGQIIAVFRLAFGVAAIVIFLVWFYRVNKNLRRLGNDNLEFTPGWAVGWFFIPFANLVRPFQVMREVWEGSDPDRLPTEEYSSNPLISYSSGASGLVIAWWALFLLSNLVGNITSLLLAGSDPGIGDLQVSTTVNIVWHALISVSILVTVRLIDRITKWQHQRGQLIHQRVAERYLTPPEHGSAGGQALEQS